MNSYRFENMEDRHRSAVIDIFNSYIENSYAAYPEESVDYGFFDRFLDMTRGYPAVVVKNKENVMGFAFLHAYRPGPTFSRVAEITYFILPEHMGKGIGEMILERFKLAAKKQGIETLLANISSLNEGSIRFHSSHGFKECGRFRRIGKKFGQDFDVVWMQLDL